MNEFRFVVYSSRKSCDLTYRIKKIPTGWDISYIAINGHCKPDGTPLFYSNFEQDFINYPSSFGNLLEWIWGQINNGEMTHEEAQLKLQELADWVTICEKSEPRWKEYNLRTI
ncbi:MAG: hypothetical protein EPN17_09830 [Methylobacter sp.]|nr:MAG: hypothetical protein EPN17_09830 [Methylobacter sp.]